ncbi:hypothetical protein QBC34DRAFT_443203 [Podospora aff. communis PSN243]|uniref:Heterokaryon incompatibility domain-containing protein n=1 Tax=Podospora aff. communis PSN243 TaxID=3040156 RepID=A0AAV9G6B6_9PEZI|nr:hypothetical protein QBC34DRAFT_443203 [Podospora aff. communis PSN243]
MLCGLCEELDFDKLHYEWSPSGYAHHSSLEELAACTSCQFCSALHNTIKDGPELGGAAAPENWRHLPLFLRVIPTSDALGSEDDISNLLVFAQRSPEEGGHPVYLVMFGLFLDRTATERKTGERDPTRCKHIQGIKGRPVSAFSNSDECFQLLQMWHRRCLEEEKPHAFSFIPTRTIDVGPPDGTQNPLLVVHDENSTSFPWTLHEWTSAGIPTLLLPPTFRDAVLITRRLGYRHLWIDSLCIIQDSREDWEREALRMGDVYRYGELNISASAARNCHEGIFAKRDSPAYFSSAIRLPFRSAKFEVGLDHREWMYVRPGNWDSFREHITGAESTLASRGWVLQEALLSPRTVHYSRRQMFWECEHGTFAEGRVDALARPSAKAMLLAPAPGLWSHKMILPPTLPEGVPPADGEKERVEVHTSWLQVVENYSARKLTVPTDVLPALAGAASVFQTRLKGSYLAGLFRGYLLEGLMWRTKTGAPAALRPGSKLPSWSWSSIIGGVTFEIAYSSNVLPPVLVGTATARILEARTFLTSGETAPPHHLASVNGGRLLVDGHVLEGAEMVARNYQTYGGLLLEATDDSRTVYRRIGIAMLKVRDDTKYRELSANDEEVIRGWERRSVTML